MNVRALIDALNNLTSGELSTLERRVREVRQEVEGAGLDEIAAILDEALSHLERADIKAFRKKLQHAVSRLGHVRGGATPSRPATPRSLRTRP